MWLHCSWTSVNSHLVVALIAAGIAAGLAWWYQRETKIMEFQFQALKEVIRVLIDFTDPSWQHFKTQINLEIGRQARCNDSKMREIRNEMRLHGEHLHLVLMSAFALTPTIDLVFSPATATTWKTMVTRMGHVADENNPRDVGEELVAIIGDRLNFLQEASREMRVPFAGPVVQEGDGQEGVRARVNEWLQRIQPPTDPGPGGRTSDSGLDRREDR